MNDFNNKQNETNEQEVIEVTETNQELEQNKHKPIEKKTSKFPHVMSGLLGGIIAAVLVVVLFLSNVIPLNTQGTNTLENNTSDAPGMISTVVSTDEHDPKGIEQTSKAVVGISNIQQRSAWTPNEEVGSGSGIIYKKENGKAYVVTNNHVVEGAEEVEIDINNEQRLPAKVLGTDPLTDLAVLEVDGSTIEYVAELGSSDDLIVGDTVLAIGNPLGMDFSGSVTKGIVSGLDRAVKVDTTGDNQPDWIAQVIQTDAAINPGNSGGALVNSDGEVIGINSMKIARQAVEGIGFAIPIDAALPLMEQLEVNGEISRPFIGVSTVEIGQVPPEYRNQIILPAGVTKGMVVASVQAGSPADKAGLTQFDVITKINDNDITSSLDLRSYLYTETGIGDKIKVEIYRNGKQEILELELTDQTI